MIPDPEPAQGAQGKCSIRGKELGDKRERLYQVLISSSLPCQKLIRSKTKDEELQETLNKIDKDSKSLRVFGDCRCQRLAEVKWMSRKSKKTSDRNSSRKHFISH